MLESTLSLCEINGKFLSVHINTKHLLTSVALLLRLSKPGMMPDTITELPLFFNYVVTSIIDFEIWLAAFSVRRSFVPMCKIMWFGFSSRRVGFTWSTIQLTFVSENDCNLMRCLCLTFFVRKWPFNSWSYCLLKYISDFSSGYCCPWVYFSPLPFFLLSSSLFLISLFSSPPLFLVFFFLTFLSSLVSFFSV